MKIIQSGIALAGSADAARSSLSFPSLCILPSGRWIVGCRAAPEKIPTRGQHVLLAHSDDEGQSWSTPVAPFAPPQIDGRPGLLRGAYLTVLG